MRVIDVHTHIFPDSIAAKAIDSLKAKSHSIAFTDGRFDSLSGSMTEAGIKYSFIQPVATKPEQVRHINDRAIIINSSGSSTGIYSFGAVHPDYYDYNKELIRLSDSGIKGIKIHPVYQGVNIDDERYIGILRLAGELGLLVMIHAGWDIGFPGNDYALPERISRALDASGRVNVILAHMGGWRCWNEAERLFAGREGVYIDTAFSLGEFLPNGDGYYRNHEECMMLSDSEFVRIIRSFGAERVLFGSDSPWASQVESVNNFIALPLTNEEKADILYNNSSRLLFNEVL